MPTSPRLADDRSRAAGATCASCAGSLIPCPRADAVVAYPGRGVIGSAARHKH